MAFKKFLSEALILEGGAAIKGSHPLTQAEAREITAQVVRDLKAKLKLASAQIAPVGSAGLKAPDQLSGDIDIAVEADVTAVKKAVEELALDGRFRHMPGLNVYSYAKLHGSKTAQVDIIPTTNIKLAKWAYHNDPVDLKLGLKGSHRNELLFAIAKYAEYVSKKKDANGVDSARERLVFDLSRGLYRFTQDRAGKKGLKKSFETRDKVLLTSDPDKICQRLLGVPAAAAMTFHEVLKVMLSKTFKHKAKLKQIIDRAIEGLEQKKLAVPHELRVAIISEERQAGQSSRQLAFQLQQRAIDNGFDYMLNVMSPHEEEMHVKALNKMRIGSSYKKVKGYTLALPDDIVERALEKYQQLADEEPQQFEVDDDTGKLIPVHKPPLHDIQFESFPVTITIGDNGTYVLYRDLLCHKPFTYGVDLKRDVDALKDFDYYFKINRRYLDEGLNSDLINLQSKLLDDLPDGFDATIKKDPYGKGYREHYVELSYRDLRSTRVYVGPSLIDGGNTLYELDGASGFKSYKEILKHLLEKFEYWITRWHEAGHKLDESRQDLFKLQQRLIEDLPSDINVDIVKLSPPRRNITEAVELSDPKQKIKGSVRVHADGTKEQLYERFFAAPWSEDRYRVLVGPSDSTLRYQDLVFSFMTKVHRESERDKLDDQICARINESVELNREMMFYLQTKLLELELKQGEVEAKFIAPDMLMVHFPEQYRCSMLAHKVHDLLSIFVDLKTENKLYYLTKNIPTKAENTDKVRVFVNGSTLSNGSKDEFFDVWEDALGFFVDKEAKAYVAKIESAL